MIQIIESQRKVVCAMSENWDRELKKLIRNDVEGIDLEELTQNKLLEKIHSRIEVRKKIMKISNKRVIIAMVTAAMMIGTFTVMAAGNIVGLISQTDRKNDILTVEKLEKIAEERLEKDLIIPESLTDGSAFANGQVSDMQGVDEKKNVMVSYPEVYIIYGDEGDGGITLSISKFLEQFPEGAISYDLEEEYRGINLQVKVEQYLFLPPNKEPSESDKALSAEGKLFIGFGSSEEERKVFKNVSWIKDDLQYKLFTYSNKSLEEMVSLAKGIVDGD